MNMRRESKEEVLEEEEMSLSLIKIKAYQPSNGKDEQKLFSNPSSLKNSVERLKMGCWNEIN